MVTKIGFILLFHPINTTHHQGDSHITLRIWVGINTQMKASVTILICNKLEFISKLIKRYMGGNNILMNAKIHLYDIWILTKLIIGDLDSQSQQQTGNLERKKDPNKEVLDLKGFYSIFYPKHKRIHLLSEPRGTFYKLTTYSDT